MRTNRETKKLQFEFTLKEISDLDKLCENTLAVTRAEVIRKALLIYTYLSKMKKEEYELQAVKGKKVISIILL